MANIEIRRAAKEKQIPLWKIADALGIQDYTLSRKLRHELPEDEQKSICNIIQKLAAERQAI